MKWKLFDRFENRIRGWLSRRPILYGLVGGVGVVLFWRGVWHGTDILSEYFINWRSNCPTADIVFLLDKCSTMDLAFPLDSILSILIGSTLLLVSGLFVSTFLGNEIAISGLRGERRLTEKTEVEVRTETGAIGDIRHEMRMVLRRLESIENKMDAQGAPKDDQVE